MVLTGAPGAGVRSSVLLNSVEYAIRGGVRESSRAGETKEKTYYLNAWSGGVGARSSVNPSGWPRPNMVYDATADTSKPGGITPALLKNTATLAGTPTQIARIFAMAEVGGVLNAFSFGSVAGSPRLLRHEWDGATATWTKNDVTGAAVSSIGSNTATINSNLVVHCASATKDGYVYSVNGTSWTAHPDTTILTGGTGWVSNMGTSLTGYALLADRGLYSFTIGANYTSVLATVYPSTETVKSFFSWKNSAGVDVLYILTDKSMFESNSTPNAFTKWENFAGGNIAFAYGSALYIGHGDKGGVTELQHDTNKDIVSAEGGLDQGDGLPSDVVGAVKSFAFRDGYLYALVSAGAASIKNAVYKRRIPFSREDGWHAVYKSATANQASAVIAISSADEATPITRLHIAEKNASATDFLYYVAMSGTLSYEASTVTFPEIVFPGTNCAVTEATLQADGLSATETIILAFDDDGAGSYTDFATWTATGAQKPSTPDAGVTMNRAIPRITFANSPATDHATYRALEFTVLIKKGLRFEYSFVVDLSISCWTARLVTVNDVRAQLRNLLSTGGLQTFQKDKVVDSTARRVSVVGYQTDADAISRHLGESGKRIDTRNMALITVREAIGA